MPSIRERQRNNIRAGIFTSISIFLAVAVIVSLSDVKGMLTARPNTYQVTFDVETGVQALDKGSVVRVGGINLGKVTDVSLIAGDPGVRDVIVVTFGLDQSVQLFPGARVEVGAALIGSEAWLAINDLGRERDEDGTPIDPLPDGGQLYGISPPGMLDRIVGKDADEILDNVKQASAFLGSLEEKYERDIIPIVDDVKNTTSDVRAVAKDLRDERWPQWAERVDNVMTWTDGLTKRVDGAVEEGRGMLEAGRLMIVDNRPKVDNAVENVEDASTRIESIAAEIQETTMGKVHLVLDEAYTTIDNASATARRLRVDFEDWSTGLSDTIGSAQLAAQQLKLATIEVRRSPWKILYRPSNTELEHELLYEAARSFALATADLKAATITAERMLNAHGDQLRQDPELYDRVQRNLVEPLRNYEEAQQRLLDVLLVE